MMAFDPTFELHFPLPFPVLYAIGTHTASGPPLFNPAPLLRDTENPSTVVIFYSQANHDSVTAAVNLSVYKCLQVSS